MVGQKQGSALEGIKASFKVVSQSRQHGLRRVVISCIVLYGLFYICMGSHSLDNSFIRKNFEWATADEFNLWYSQYSAITLSLNIVSLFALLPLLSRVLKLDDLLIVFLSCCIHLMALVSASD